MATSPRFTTSQFYPEGLVLFVGTAGMALVVIWRRWQRQAMELQRELEAISVSGSASSLKESSHDHVCSRIAARGLRTASLLADRQRPRPLRRRR